VGEAIEQVTGVAFENINRQAVYQSRLNPLSQIGLKANADAVKNNIRRSITTSIVQGEGIPKMAKRITKDLEQNANNAVRIARTETTRAMGEARQETFKEAEDMGIEIQKRWLATSDDRTRHSHVELNNQIVDNDKKFSNGLAYPGDPSGPAIEVINCRCTMIAFLPEYEEKPKK
jgi:SPP1 gp7 family putative phage head morphogenesis protein